MPSAHNDAMPVILWFRRDLRLRDNLALQAAISDGNPVICIYIREEGVQHSGVLGRAQAWWLHHSLASLGRSIEEAGNRLLLFSGKPLDVLERLIGQTGARSVFWNRRYDPDGIACDVEIKSRLRAKEVEARSFSGFLMHEPGKLLTKQNSHYQVFTPFWKAFEAGFHPQHPLPAPRRMVAPARFPDDEKLDHWCLLPKKPDWAGGFAHRWQPGEKGALARLETFLDEHLAGYKDYRDIPGKRTTSALSPHLAMGEISPHRIWNDTRNAFGSGYDEDVIAFRRELVWREFSWHLLFHRPDMPTVNLDRRFDAFAWRGDDRKRVAWQRGQTGYPIVDAGMRELWQTGFMHNRVRMIVASFLIKDLLIDWRDGERWFRDTLVDADCANNAMNWQWVAGSGADASPWFRIFNPVKQGETFDPDGSYVRRYCPELAALPDKYIHRPFRAPKPVLETAGIGLGVTYPEPIVIHEEARTAALAAFGLVAASSQRP